MGSAISFKDVDLETWKDQTNIAMLVGFIPGATFFVDSSIGSSTNPGTTRAAPFATLAQGLAACLDNKGHVIYIVPGHSETLAAAGLTWSQAGVTVIGGGNGRSRPAITCPTADVVGITMSGANNLLRNVRIIGSASQTSKASTLISVTAADCQIDGCSLEHGSTGPIDGIKLVAATRCKITNNYFYGVGTASQVAIQVKSNLVDGQINDNQFNYGVNLLKSAVIFASLGSNLSGTNILRNIAVGTKIAFTDISASVIGAGATEGMIAGNRVGYGNTTTVAFLTGQTGFKTGGLAACDNWFNNAKHAHPMVPGTFLNKASVVNNNAFRFSLPT